MKLVTLNDGAVARIIYCIVPKVSWVGASRSVEFIALDEVVTTPEPRGGRGNEDVGTAVVMEDVVNDSHMMGVADCVVTMEFVTVVGIGNFKIPHFDILAGFTPRTVKPALRC